jgi:hypothetical protein
VPFFFIELLCAMIVIFRASPLVLHSKPKMGCLWKDTKCGRTSIQASFGGQNLTSEGIALERQLDMGEQSFHN